MLSLNSPSRLLTGAAFIAVSAAIAAEELPISVARGEPLVAEDFTQTDAVARWRLGKGSWTIADGALRGTEKPEDHHAAGLACQRQHHDAVIQFRFQLQGGKSATLLLRNRFGNLCRIYFTPTTAVLQKDRPNLPANTPEKTEILAKAAVMLRSGEWHDVAAVVRGPEFAVTLDGRTTLKGSHPAIDVDKTEIEFMASGDSVLFDDLRAWTIAPESAASAK